MVREALRRVLLFLFRVLTRLEVVGEENLPATGGCLLAANHLSRLDPPLVFCLLKRKDSTGLIARKYKKYPVFNWIIEGAQGIWLDRDNPDFGALRTAVKYLRAGGMIGIAPEGTRSSTGGLMQPKPGVAFLAVKADVPIVPVAISGTEETMRALARFRRAPILVEYGQPFRVGNGGGQVQERSGDKDAVLQQAADEIMCQIARLLPAKYWGVYADHPRLKELLHPNGQKDPSRASSLPVEDVF